MRIAIIFVTDCLLLLLLLLFVCLFVSVCCCCFVVVDAMSGNVLQKIAMFYNINNNKKQVREGKVWSTGFCPNLFATDTDWLLFW